MKKLILLVITIFTISFITISCKNDKTEVDQEVKTEVKTEIEQEVKTEVEQEVKTEAEQEVKTEAEQKVKKEISTLVYQCPKDCEHGKTYSESNATCPKCKTALEPVKKKPDHQ